MITSIASMQDKKRTENLDIYFGQFSGIGKTKRQTEFYHKAIAFQEQQQYLECVQAYLEYLTDERYNNVVCQKDGKQLSFIIYQGPVILRGLVSGNELRVETIIAHFVQPENGLLEYLLQENIKFFNCRFLLEGNLIRCRTELDLTRSGLPGILYMHLAELAMQSEKSYRHIQSNFPQATPADPAADIPVPAAEASVKYKYFRQWTEEILNKAEEQEESGASYLLRVLAYRLDFLLAPEGAMKKALNDLHWIYFADDGSSEASRNQRMKMLLTQLLAKPADEIMESFSRTLYTFTKKRKPKQLEVLELLNELEPEIGIYAGMGDEYMVRNLREIALLNMQYVCQIPRPWTAYLLICMQVGYSTFFEELGLPAYRAADGAIDQQGVKEAISAIENKWNHYPEFRFNKEKLNFTDDASFSRSYIDQLASLNFNL